MSDEYRRVEIVTTAAPLVMLGEPMKKVIRHTFAYIVALGMIGLGAVSIAQTTTSESYEYDALGRLITVTRDLGLSAEYQYDPAGNRTGVTTNRGSGGGAIVVVPLNGYTVIPIG